MGRIADTFGTLRARGEKALVLFVTAGDPALEDLPAILDTLAEGGADLIEVGLPFSDPIADGPTIQASSHRALERGVTTRGVLDALAGFDRVPVVLMGYTNPMLRMTLPGFAAAARAAGASGSIVCDMIPEEGGAWAVAARTEGLDTVYLAAPTSTDARLDAVCAVSRGFLYAVSRTGVTGASSRQGDEAEALVARLRARTDLPVCVGFGISTPEDVRAVCRFADGAVVGSWLVDRLARDWDGGRGRAGLLESIRALKDATRPGS